MAVDSATLSTASGILKNNYEGPIVDQINNPNAFWANLDKNSKDIVQGAAVVLNLRMNPSQAIGARAELGTLPAAQRTRNVQPSITLKYLYGVMRVSGPIMEASKTDKGAFIRVVRNESEGITLALKLDLNRQCYGDSNGDGRVATCGTTSSSTTVALAVGTNMLYFEIGMLVDIRTFSTGTAVSNGTSREIIAIDTTASAPTITLDAAGGSVSTTATTDGVFRAGNRSNELNGLENIIAASGSLHSIDPATAGNERWKSYVDSNFGAFDLMKFQEAVDTVHNNSGEWIDMIFSQQGPRNAYLSRLMADRRIVSQGDDKKLNGGFSGLAYTGGGTEAVWVKDPFVPSAGTVYGVTMKRLEFRRAKDFEFVEMNGSNWLPDIFGSSGVDAYKAVLATYGEIITTKRNAHFKLQNVASGS